MIWANNISELQYYNQPPPPAPCYCEHLAYPGDLLLQGSFVSSASSGFTMLVEVMSPDGITVYEDATTYFQYYFFVYNGLRYFNLQLKTYSPEMCSRPCWVLKVTVSIGSNVFFSKYTQRYCQSSCCDIPRDITYTPEGQDPEPPTSTTTAVPLSDCGRPLIRIEVTFPCLDNQLGDYYGIPSDVLSGTASFSFKKITNIVGQINQRPREITREISYNCNLQRAESFKPFLLETTTYASPFPTWKMNELESMFHAPLIYVTDFYTEAYYQFQGGVICEKLYKCWEIYRLKATLQSCTVRQVFGCNENCTQATAALKYLIPQNYGGGNFYSENREIIGDFDQLMTWFSGQANVTSVTDVSADYDNVYGAIYVQGTGYIPTSFFFDIVTPRTRVFGVNAPVSPIVSCAIPLIGEITSEADICATPTIGTITSEDIPATEIDIVSYGNWVVSDGSGGEVSDGIGRFDITSTNDVDIVTSPLTFFNQEIIGVIVPYSRPSSPASIQIDSDSLLTIDTNGVIRYTGYATSYTETQTIITLTNIYYQL